MLVTLKVIAAIVTVYFVVMLIKEFVIIARDRDSYNDSVELP